jgi:carbamoyltransferase
MFILGITHTISWNTAVALLENEKVIACAEEERFVRIKHAPRMIPINAINYVLKSNNIKFEDIEKIAISWEGPHNENSIKESIDKGIQSGSNESVEQGFWKISLEKETELLNFLRNLFPNAELFFIPHHIAHAASTCYMSGFEKSMFFTVDGRGEYESGLLGIFNKGEFEIINNLDLDQSLGNMYAQFTEKIGFQGHSEEGTVMGLAPYGKMKDSLEDIVVYEQNSIKIDWNKINSIPKRQYNTNDPTKDDRKDLAFSVQHLLEKSALSLISNLVEQTNESKLCLAGGTALNIDMNGAIIESGLVKEIFIQPASNDAGCALGAALFLHSQFSSKKPKKMEHAYLGLEIDSNEIESSIKKNNLTYTKSENITKEVSELISQNKIIAWIQGKAEYGPRSLGARSLLSNPTDEKMSDKMNKIKKRQYWRPFAPSILEEKVDDYFINHGMKSPFMLLKFQVKEEQKEKIPAVVHVDGSSRPQTVSKNSNQIYWELIDNFYQKTGVPLILNTSLNLKGEPIVNDLKDGIKMLFNSEVDFLCVNNYLIEKER